MKEVFWGIFSNITAKRKEIDDLLNDANNLEPVQMILAEITHLFWNFVEAQNAYRSELVDLARREDSNAFFNKFKVYLCSR